MTAVIEVELLYSPGCPHVELARRRLAGALALIHAEADIRLRQTTDRSGRWPPGWSGSPTILVRGVDLFGGTPSSIGAACRRYLTPTGAEGAPSIESLVEALSGATTEAQP